MIAGVFTGSASGSRSASLAEQQAFAEDHEAHELVMMMNQCVQKISGVRTNVSPLALGCRNPGARTHTGSAYADAAVNLSCVATRSHMPQRPCARVAPQCQRHTKEPGTALPVNRSARGTETS